MLNHYSTFILSTLLPPPPLRLIGTVHTYSHSRQPKLKKGVQQDLNLRPPAPQSIVLSTTPGGFDGIDIDLLSISACMRACMRACVRACLCVCVLALQIVDRKIPYCALWLVFFWEHPHEVGQRSN